MRNRRNDETSDTAKKLVQLVIHESCQTHCINHTEKNGAIFPLIFSNYSNLTMTTITSTFLKDKCELFNQVCFFLREDVSIFKHKSGICQCIGMCTQCIAIEPSQTWLEVFCNSQGETVRDGIIR